MSDEKFSQRNRERSEEAAESGAWRLYLTLMTGGAPPKVMKEWLWLVIPA
jgi:hypothetical protein